MKRIVVITSLLGIASLAYAQPTGSQSSANQGSNNRYPPASQQGLPPGLQNRDQLPPGLQNRDQLPPGLSKRQATPDTEGTAAVGAGGQFETSGSATGSAQSITSPSVYGTNTQTTQAGFGSATNQSGFATGSATNQTSLTPTSDQGQTRTYATNSSTTTTQTTITRDIAYAPADRTLLTQVKQIVLPMVGVTATSTTAATGAWAPVHFQIREGVVTLVGFVPSEQVKMQIEQRVQTILGVNRVVNQLEIREASATQTTGTPGYTASTSTTLRDVADSPADRALLTQVRQIVVPLFGTTVAAGRIPVNFVVRDGIVTLVGSVPDPQQKTIIEQRIQRIPGVVRVVNQVQVSQTSTTTTTGAVGGTSDTSDTGSTTGSATSSQGAGTTSGLGGSSTGAATSVTSPASVTGTNEFTTRAEAGMASTNQFTTSSTNTADSGLTPTGSNTNRTYGTNTAWTNRSGLPTNGTNTAWTNRSGLPPGLRDREQLPPGLEKRDELPPGLQRRLGTNTTTTGSTNR